MWILRGSNEDDSECDVEQDANKMRAAAPTEGRGVHDKSRKTAHGHAVRTMEFL